MVRLVDEDAVKVRNSLLQVYCVPFIVAESEIRDENIAGVKYIYFQFLDFAAAKKYVNYLN